MLANQNKPVIVTLIIFKTNHLCLSTRGATTFMLICPRPPIHHHWFPQQQPTKRLHLSWLPKSLQSSYLFLNSRFGCGSVNLAWSNSCNYVFGFSEIYDLFHSAGSQVCSLARHQNIMKISLQHHPSVTTWPTAVTKNNHQSNWTDCCFW